MKLTDSTREMLETLKNHASHSLKMEDGVLHCTDCGDALLANDDSRISHQDFSDHNGHTVQITKHYRDGPDSLLDSVTLECTSCDAKLEDVEPNAV